MITHCCFYLFLLVYHSIYSLPYFSNFTYYWFHSSIPPRNLSTNSLVESPFTKSLVFLSSRISVLYCLYLLISVFSYLSSIQEWTTLPIKAYPLIPISTIFAIVHTLDQSIAFHSYPVYSYFPIVNTISTLPSIYLFPQSKPIYIWSSFGWSPFYSLPIYLCIKHSVTPVCFIDPISSLEWIYGHSWDIQCLVYHYYSN